MSDNEIDYSTVPLDFKLCKRCFELWNKNDSNAYYNHIWEHSAKPKKQWAFTLTTNGDDVTEETDRLCSAVYKVFQQQTTPVEVGGAWLEYTEAGRPHIHGWYQTVQGGRVFAKTFQRCWPLWKEKRGMTRFAGGYHEQMKTNRYIGYASAEGREVIQKKKDAEIVFTPPA